MSCCRDQIRSSARGRVYNQHSSVSVFSVETGAAQSDVDLVSREGQKKNNNCEHQNLKAERVEWLPPGCWIENVLYTLI